MTPVPVLTVCSLDPVLRDTAASGLLCDIPGSVVLRHDLTPDRLLHRAVYDRGGLREQETIDLDHGCLSCALREDIIPSLRQLVSDPVSPPTVLILALPATAEALPLIRALQPLDGRPAVPGASVAAVLAAIDAATFATDLLGDDLLAERGLHTSAEDRRSVGETLAQVVEFADAVITPNPAPDVTAHLLAHLSGPDVPVLDLHAADPFGLLQVRRRHDDPRGDLRQVSASSATDTDRVWTLDLNTWRPMHPDRLHESIEALGAGPIRGRGVFWLPTRPDLVGAWDGAGGQLSIGSIGAWGGCERRTRLVITGVDHDPNPVREAFERALLSDAELGRGLNWWAGRDDGFDPWLGEHRLSA
jgi:G3E family GTPase